MSQQDNQSERGGGAEFIKFGVLAAVLVVTVLVIALIKPLIFGRIVPAVFRLDQLKVTPTTAPVEAEVEDSAPVGEEVEVPDEQSGENGVEVDSTEEQSEETAGETTDPANEAPPVSTTTIQHTVQPGESLFAISRRYGVSVEVIAAANGIVNPNQLVAGTVLIIPQP